MKKDEKRMQTSRCARLCAVAIANKLDEVWISKQPILLFVYLSQYMPFIFTGYVFQVAYEHIEFGTASLCFSSVKRIIYILCFICIAYCAKIKFN